MSKHRDPAAEAWGRWAEGIVRDIYCRMGKFVLPAHLINNGGAPKIVGYFRDIVSMDLLVCWGGNAEWHDVKFKTCPVLFSVTGMYRHGIDLPNWKAYRLGEKVSGIPGYISLLQFKPGAYADPDPYLLLQSLSHLEKVIQVDERPTRNAPGGMVYWDVDEMDVVCRLPLSDAPDIPSVERTIHAWEERAKSGRAPQANMNVQQRAFPLGPHNFKREWSE